MNSRADPPIIEVESLRKTYGAGPGAVAAIREISFSAFPGEFLSIVGPSGCGKSTLLHLIAGLSSPSGGSVRIGGRDITHLTDAAVSRLRARQIGFVFQRFNLLPALTVGENIALAQEIRLLEGSGDRETDEILELLGLGGKKARRPAELSMGEQQRVAIARAIIHRPAILLADEPTGNLDSENAEAIVRTFRRMNDERGQTILMVTHNREVAEAAVRTIRMRDGRIV